jgi:hypothetical protein
MIGCGDAVLTRGRHRGCVGGDGVVVDAPVQRIGHLGGVTQQQGVLADGHVFPVAGQCVGGHGDLIPAVKPIMLDVPVDGFADWFWCAIAQGQRPEGLNGLAGYWPEDLCDAQIAEFENHS